MAKVAAWIFLGQTVGHLSGPEFAVAGQLAAYIPDRNHYRILGCQFLVFDTVVDGCLVKQGEIGLVSHSIREHVAIIDGVMTQIAELTSIYMAALVLLVRSTLLV